MSTERVKELAERMGILEHSTPLKQFGKLLEEVHELAEAIESGNEEQVMNEFGDVLFVMEVLDLMGSYFVDLVAIESIYEYTSERIVGNIYKAASLSLTLACDKVEKRIAGGKLIDGVFVKEADL